MLKYILIALATGAAWAAFVWLQMPMWIALAISAAAVVTVATIIAIKRLRARRASREIERALKAQAQAQARAARPDLEADIAALHGEFDKAIEALKGSRLGARGAASALYALPWYVLVGPPGAGKSTALRNCGLRFPFLSSRGGASVQGVGGTRNCEWWMTTEGVILDTAGRYATQGEDREEWFAFLDLLRKYRVRRPINGVIAAVSVADIADAHPQEAASLSAELRARIDELQQRLGVVVPVYLVFTKCDLLPGFVEMFGDLTDADRDQIWGFTFAANDQADMPRRSGEHFDELTAVLEKRALRRLAEERGADRRDRIHEFPQYVADLRERVVDFVDTMTEGSIYNETPVLRGVYLSSGTQEGRPVDRIMSSIAEAFGLRRAGASNTTAPEDARSYFLGGIFRSVIFPDFRLTRLSRARTRRTRITGNVAGAVAVLVAAALVWLPLISFRHNRMLLADASTAVAYVEEHVDDDTVDAIAVDRIEPLRRMVELLEAYEDGGEPWTMRLGTYRVGRVYPRLRDVYADTVRRELAMPTLEVELAELRRFAMRHGANTKPPSTEVYSEQFARLRLYLLLTTPAPGEPALAASELDFAAAALTRRWERPLRLAGDGSTLTSIERVARTYLEIVADRPEIAFERDATLVEDVRRILRNADRTKALTDALVASISGKSVTLQELVQPAPLHNDDYVIRPAFTREAYFASVLPLFDGGMDALLDPQWVLAPAEDGSAQRRAQDIDAVKDEYFKQYIKEWRGFVDSIYLDASRRRGGLRTLVLLKDLTGSEPYSALFSAVAWHTQLVPPTQASAGPEPQSELERQAKRALNIAINRQVGGAVSRTRAAEVGVTTGVVKAGVGSLLPSATGAANGNVRRTSEHDLARAFAPLVRFGARAEGDAAEAADAAPRPIDQYEEQLKSVRDALDGWLEDPADREPFDKPLKVARAKVRALLSEQAGKEWSSTLEKLLWPPLELAERTIAANEVETSQQLWCDEVVARRNKIANGYPFSTRERDVALADFKRFFAPEHGELWRTWNEALSKQIPRRGDHFVVSKRASTRARFSPAVPAFFNAANEITQTMFTEGELKVEFEVLVRGAAGIDEISLVVNDSKLVYRNGREHWTSFEWPGDGEAGAAVEVKGHNRRGDVQAPGEWGLFRLLEQGTVAKTNDPRIFKVQWDLRDENAGLIEMLFKTKSADAPFFGFSGERSFMSIFRTKHLTPPPAIMIGARKCK